jgi:hypothetical protein
MNWISFKTNAHKEAKMKLQAGAAFITIVILFTGIVHADESRDIVAIHDSVVWTGISYTEAKSRVTSDSKALGNYVNEAEIDELYTNKFGPPDLTRRSESAGTGGGEVHRINLDQYLPKKDYHRYADTGSYDDIERKGERSDRERERRDWAQHPVPDPGESARVHEEIRSVFDGPARAAVASPPVDAPTRAERTAEIEKNNATYSDLIKSFADKYTYNSNGTFGPKDGSKNDDGTPAFVTESILLQDCIGAHHTEAQCQSALTRYEDLHRRDLDERAQLTSAAKDAATQADGAAKEKKEQDELDAREKSCKEDPAKYIDARSKDLIDAAKKYRDLAKGFATNALQLKDNTNRCLQNFANLKSAQAKYLDVKAAGTTTCDNGENGVFNYQAKILKEAGLDDLENLNKIAEGRTFSQVDNVQTKSIKATELADLLAKQSADGKVGVDCQGVLPKVINVDRNNNSMNIALDQFPVYETIKVDDKNNCLWGYCKKKDERVEKGTASDNVLTVAGAVTANSFKIARIKGCEISESAETEYVGRLGTTDPQVTGKRDAETRVLINDSEGLVGLRKTVTQWDELPGVSHASDKSAPEGKVSTNAYDNGIGCGSTLTADQRIKSGSEDDDDFASPSSNKSYDDYAKKKVAAYRAKYPQYGYENKLPSPYPYLARPPGGQGELSRIPTNGFRDDFLETDR